MLENKETANTAEAFAGATDKDQEARKTAVPPKKPVMRHPSGGSADLGPDPSPSNFAQGPLNGPGW